MNKDKVIEIAIDSGFHYREGLLDLGNMSDYTATVALNRFANAIEQELCSGEPVGEVSDASYFDGQVSEYKPNGNLIKAHGIDYNQQDITALSIGTNLYTSPQPDQSAIIKELEAECANLIKIIDDNKHELIDIKNSLQFANESVGGAITDTIWMMHRPETVFDAIDGIIEALGKEE